MDVDHASKDASEPKPILALSESVVNRIAAGEVRPTRRKDAPFHGS
jgi:hypothetical protein